MEINGLTLPQILAIRRISSETRSLQPIPNRGVQCNRQTSINGDVWDIQGLASTADLDLLFGLSQNGVVWVTDTDRGNFHAILEVQSDCDVEDAEGPAYAASLLVKETVFSPTSFNPEVFA